MTNLTTLWCAFGRSVQPCLKRNFPCSSNKCEFWVDINFHFQTSMLFLDAKILKASRLPNQSRIMLPVNKKSLFFLNFISIWFSPLVADFVVSHPHRSALSAHKLRGLRADDQRDKVRRGYRKKRRFHAVPRYELGVQQLGGLRGRRHGQWHLCCLQHLRTLHGQPGAVHHSPPLSAFPHLLRPVLGERDLQREAPLRGDSL